MEKFISYKDTLINSTFPFIEALLKKYGEFFPVAAAIQKNGTIASIGSFDGNEQPLSSEVITSLKKALKEGAKKGEYLAYVIFYDVRACSPFTNEETDAVVVTYESLAEPEARNFFYPYKLTSKMHLSYSGGWDNTIPKEVFDNNIL